MKQFAKGLSWCRRPAALLLAVLPGCSGIFDADDVLTVELAEVRVPCEGMVPQECYLVRSRGGAAYQLLYDGIDGFAFEAGYRYRLRLLRRTLADPPQDGSRYEYRLRRVEAKVRSPRFELLASVREAEGRWRQAGPASYVVVEERVCACVADAKGPVRLVVRRSEGGPYERVTARSYVADGRPVPTEHALLFVGVQGLFGYIGYAIARDAAAVEVEFHEAAGYPRRVFVDGRSNVADDEVEYIVRSLDAS